VKEREVRQITNICYVTLRPDSLLRFRSYINWYLLTYLQISVRLVVYTGRYNKRKALTFCDNCINLDWHSKFFQYTPCPKISGTHFKHA